MGQRLALQTLLEELISPGNVYFQPPSNIQLTYPCIIYARNYANTQFGDNIPYKIVKRYQITIIDRDPDSVLPDKISALPMCLFDRYFVTDNLNHYTYNLYY